MARTADAGADPSVFISYRRGPTTDITGRIHDWLERELAPGRVIRDVDSIPVGVRFWEHLEEQLTDCDIMLAVIGADWAAGIGNEEDFVAEEISFALRRGMPIVPVLVGGTAMPEPAALSESMRPVTEFQAIELDSGREFRRNVVELAGALKSLHQQVLAERLNKERRAKELRQQEELEQKREAEALSLAHRKPRRRTGTILSALGIATALTLLAISHVRQENARQQAAREQAALEAARQEQDAKLEAMTRQFREQGERMQRLQEDLAHVKDEAQRARIERELMDAASRRTELKKAGAAVRASAKPGGGAASRPCNCPAGDPLCSCL